MIRAFIVDDEPLARESARLALVADPEVEVVGACSGAEAVAQILAARPELLILDVQMPVVDGFGVLAALGAHAPPAIVFVTAYDQYAVRAFEVHALDYVLKPYDDRRLLAAVARAKARVGERHIERFFVRGRDRVQIVDARDVDCLEAADDYVELHVGDTVHIIRERLADLEGRLDPARFFRIHRSAIVNLERVREIHPLVRGDALVVLAGGASFRCSRTRRGDFERRLSDSPRREDRSPHPR